MIETERLLLRPPIAADFEPWATFQADEIATRFLGGVQVRSVAWRSFTSIAGSWALYGFGMFSVIEKASGRWIGRMGPWRPDGWPGNEIAYSLVRDVHGKGYAVEGVKASIAFAFEKLGWDDVVHCIHPENIASRRVAERVGSTLRGPGKLPAPLDELRVDLYGQSRPQE